jgi:hypothetical protein
MTTAYDRPTLYSRLAEAASLAGELYYVDSVLAFIAAEHQSPGAGGGPEPQIFWINDIGQTFPFRRKIVKVTPSAGFEERISSFLAEAAAEAQTWRDSNLETLSRLIAPLTHPDTTYYEAIVHRLETCYMTLAADPEEGEIPPPGTTAMRRTDFGMLAPETWAGDAADNFRDNFYNPFKYDVRSHQAAFTKAIAAGFVEAKAIDDLAQLSLLDAVTSTRDALSVQLEQRQENRDYVSEVKALIIASEGANMLSLIAAPAPLASVGMGVISGSLRWVADGMAAKAREQEEFQGQSADDLFGGLYGMASKISRNTRIQYTELDASLGSLIGWADEHERFLTPRRPFIAERDENDKLNPDHAEFYHSLR